MTNESFRVDDESLIDIPFVTCLSTYAFSLSSTTFFQSSRVLMLNDLIDRKYYLTSGYGNTYGRLERDKPSTTITNNLATPSERHRFCFPQIDTNLETTVSLHLPLALTLYVVRNVGSPTKSL